MALTEEQKQRIAEEEEYRAKIREESQPRKKGCSGCFIAILIILALPLLLAITLLVINPAKQFEDAEKNATAINGLEVKSGSFTDLTGAEYKYEITSEEGDDGNKKYVASYTPFLQNNDYTLLKAVYLAFETAYGKDGRIVPTPYFEERNGRNLIKFAGNNESYYVFPVKEDTGEIHTLMFWKE
jgi:hypothetical protein